MLRIAQGIAEALLMGPYSRMKGLIVSGHSMGHGGYKGRGLGQRIHGNTLIYGSGWPKRIAKKDVVFQKAPARVKKSGERTGVHQENKTSNDEVDVEA